MSLRCVFFFFLITNGVETLQRVSDADEVLPVVNARAGVRELALGFWRWKMRSAVDQPEALCAVEQNDTWCREERGGVHSRSL